MWCCTSASATQAIVPVATKLSGSVTVQTSDGAQHEVITSKLLHSGDIVSTGPDSLAVVDLADVGRVLIGPASAARTQTLASGLSVQITSGLLCLESKTPTVSVNAGALKVEATDASTIFDLVRTDNATKIAVYRGTVGLIMNGTSAGMLRAGEAAISSHDGAPTQATLTSVNADFAALHCPDEAVVEEAMTAGTASSESAAPAASGHGGGILGWLLGIAAIAVAAGSHSGGGTNAGDTSAAQPLPSASASPGPSPTPTATATPSSTPTPTPTPSLTPTPTPTPSPTPSPRTISVTPGSLSFSSNVEPAQNFDAHDPASHNYSASSSNLGVATVSLQGHHDHTATFSVTPVGNGSATISVTDDAGGEGQVTVTVGSSGLSATFRQAMIPTSQANPRPPLLQGEPQAGRCSLTVGATNLVFGDRMRSQLVSVSEPCYTGALHARSSDAAVVGVDPALGAGPTRTFLVTARSPGNATLTISDDQGSVQVIQVVVRGSKSVTSGRQI